MVDQATRFASPLYGTVIAASLLACLAAAYFLTVEADEAWILLSTLNAFGIALPPTDALASPTLTSGGVHLLFHGLLGLIDGSILAHRFVSFAFTLILLALVFLIIRRAGRSAATSFAGTALFVAVPGLIFQSGLATAEIIATTLLIGGCLHWAERGQWSARSAVMSGILLGLSCATRINCFVALPAVAIFALVSGEDRRSRFVTPVLAIATAVAVIALAISGYVLATANSDGGGTARFFLASSGVSGGKSLSQLIWAFAISDRIIPAWLIAAIAGACVVSVIEGARSSKRSRETRLTALLVLIGFAGLAAWIDKAPIPHLRYLWPAVPCFWLAGVLQLTRVMSVQATPLKTLPFHLLILTACGSRLAEDLLVLANGESLTLVYQANGMASSDFPGRAFRAGSDQRKAASFIASQSRDARFYTPIPPIAFPLTLLSRRTVASVDRMAPSGLRYLILNPADSTVWHPDANFVQWVRTSTTPVFVSGDVAVLRVNDRGMLPPPARMVRGGSVPLLETGETRNN